MAKRLNWDKLNLEKKASKPKIKYKRKKFKKSADSCYTSFQISERLGTTEKFVENLATELNIIPIKSGRNRFGYSYNLYDGESYLKIMNEKLRRMALK